MQLRRFMPRGLYARFMLIIVTPVVLLFLAVTYIFFDGHWQQTSRKLAQGIASDVAFMAQLHRDRITDAGWMTEHASGHLLLDVAFAPGAALPVHQKRSVFTSLDNILLHELAVRLDAEVWIDITGYDDQIEIRVLQPDGVLSFLAERDRTYSTTGHIFLIWVMGATLIFLALALGFLRNQVRSILNLAEAAKAFGDGRDTYELNPSGAREVREASRAVIDMKNSLTTFAEERTAMLAGVSHDLRTPLTRLKLQLAMMDPSEDVDAARADLEEMGAMLNEYLAFARGEEGEARAKVRLDRLIEELAESTMPGRLTLQGRLPAITVEGRPLALKRAISNLIGNALTYGDRACLSLQNGPVDAEIIIDDDGPGIPPEDREDAFKPFVRLNEARGQNLPGTGLGLALCRDTALAHGGRVELDRSPLGGLRARLRLPKLP